jgi:predicted nucleic-acid-binding protein
MKTFVLDTNVALRFLLADDSHQSPKAKALFDLADSGKIRLRFSHVAVAELVWVLKSFFDFERAKIATTVRGLLLHNGIEVDGLDVLLSALESFSRINADFPDCYAAAVAAHLKFPVTSYDRDFRKFANVTCLTPDEVLKAT